MAPARMPAMTGERAGSGGVQHALEKDLTDESRPIGAERDLDRQLGAPRNPARQQQRSGVDASAEEHQRGGAEQRRGEHRRPPADRRIEPRVTEHREAARLVSRTQRAQIRVGIRARE
jgi:hypothetical protein